MKGRTGFIPASIVILAVLGSCMNLLEPAGGNEPVPGGKGRIEVQVENSARAATLPSEPTTAALPSGAFDKYVLRFDYTGTEGYTHDPVEWSAGLLIDLEPGTWTVYVDAYIGTDVSGTGSADVTVGAGTVTPVTIYIGVMNTAAGVQGTLKYKVSYPTTAGHTYGTQALTVRNTAGTPVGSTVTLTNGVEGTVPLDPGVYFVGVLIKDTAHKTGATRTRAVHIYGGQETYLEIIIGDEDFTANAPVTVTAGLTVPSSGVTVDSRKVALYSDSTCMTTPLDTADLTALTGQAEITLWADSSITPVYARQEVKINGITGTTLTGHVEPVTMTGTSNRVSFNDTLHKVNLDAGIPAGRVTTTVPAAFAGNTVGVTVTVDADRPLKAGTLKYSSGGTDTTIGGTGPDYTFTMPGADATVKAEFYQVAWYVTAGSSAGDGSYATPYGTMDEALTGIAAAYTDSSWPNKGSASATPVRIEVTGMFTTGGTTNGMVDITDSVLYATYPPIILEGDGTLDAYTLSKRVLYINKADVTLNGSLTLTGGTVTGGNGGGGVQVLNGSFTMSGGTISSNTATYGGGVHVATGGSFTMNGGTISGNTADTYGGGVYVDVVGAGTFKKEPGPTPGNSGTINGGGVSQANTAGSGVGHAVYVSAGSKARNSTAGTGIDLDSTISGTAGGWEIVAWVDIVNAISAATAGSSVAVPGGTYTVTETLTVNKNITITPAAGAAVIFKRDSTIPFTGDMIKVTGGVLTLDKGAGSSLTLNGNGNPLNGGEDVTAAGSLVRVDSGSLTMNSGVTLTNNQTSGNGGGVYVDGSGSFTMNGGIMSANKVTSGNGGGVYVDGGTFTMSGGTIKQNDAADSGGGVYVDGGTFTMSGDAFVSTNNANWGGGVHITGTFNLSGEGDISSNTASDGAGGVFMNGGTFTMSGGTISSNITSGGNGGGVVVGGGSFTMSGGTISGNKAESGAGGGVYVANIATFKKEVNATPNNSGIICGNGETDSNLNNTASASNGHAVFMEDGKKRNNTAGATVNLNSADSAGSNGWDAP